MNNGILGEVVKSMRAADGKQEINLEWPNRSIHEIFPPRKIPAIRYTDLLNFLLVLSNAYIDIEVQYTVYKQYCSALNRSSLLPAYGPCKHLTYLIIRNTLDGQNQAKSHNHMHRLEVHSSDRSLTLHVV